MDQWRNKVRVVRRPALVVVLAVAFGWLFVPTAPAQSLWTGSGSDTNWTTAANWSVAPVSGPTLEVIFGSSPVLTSTVNTPYVLNILRFTSAAGAYTIDGSAPLTFDGTNPFLESDSASTISINPQVVAVGNLTVLGTGSGVLTFDDFWVQDGTATFNRNATIRNLRLGVDGGANNATVTTGTNTITLTGDLFFEVPVGTSAASAPAPLLSGNIFLTAGNHTFLGNNYSSLPDTGFVDFTISANLSGPGGLVKAGDPVNAISWLKLSGANTYTGPTILEENSEVTYLGATNTLPSLSAVVVKTNADLLLTDDDDSINGFSQSIGSLSDGGTPGGFVVLGPADTTVRPVLTVGNDNTSTTFSGRITRGGSLVKVGTGTLTLTHPNNNFQNGVTINGGRLNVNGQTGLNSGTGSGNVVVNNNGTFGGTGRASGNVTVTSGGRLAPGIDSVTPGTLTVGGNVTLNAGATFEVRLQSVSSFSQLVAQSNVTLSGSTLSASLGYSPVAADRFFVINMTSNAFVTGEFNGLPQGSAFTIDGNTAYISYFGDFANNTLVGGNDVVISFTPIPEPATTLAGAAALLGALGWVGRRRMISV